MCIIIIVPIVIDFSQRYFMFILLFFFFFLSLYLRVYSCVFALLRTILNVNIERLFKKKQKNIIIISILTENDYYEYVSIEFLITICYIEFGMKTFNLDQHGETFVLTQYYSLTLSFYLSVLATDEMSIIFFYFILIIVCVCLTTNFTST